LVSLRLRLTAAPLFVLALLHCQSFICWEESSLQVPTFRKDALEVQNIPARPQIAHCERMPKGVRGESDAHDARLFAEQLHIPPDIAVTCHDAASGREHEMT